MPLSRIEAAKAQLPDIAWYPYNTLSNLPVITRLLESANLTLAELIGTEPVLDIGCGDGDLTFYLESLGHKVDAIDWPATNYNNMRGVYALKKALGSHASIHSLDLNERPVLPRKHYGLIVCFGLVYHLKNPLQLLEVLARSCRYCLVNSKIASTFPGIEQDLKSVPAAYLLDGDELNNDWTNYWIFTDAGLRRLLKRAGFSVLSSESSAPHQPSAPAGVDQRMSCLVKSLVDLGSFVDAELGTGWHETEHGGWRWTARRFTVIANQAASLALTFYVPDAQAEAGPITVSCTAGSKPLGTQIYTASGEYCFRVPLPTALGSVIEFQVEHAMASAPDPRELGLFVRSIALSPAHTAPLPDARL